MCPESLILSDAKRNDVGIHNLSGRGDLDVSPSLNHLLESSRHVDNFNSPKVCSWS